MDEKRPLSPEDILFPPRKPPHYNIDDETWASKYSWWEKEWTDWETILPRGGFLEDFVLATKGTEAPTSFATWMALAVVATVLDRDAYLDLYPVRWFPNLYLILVAPPGVAKKSTVLNYGASLLRGLSAHLEDENLKYKKDVLVHTNRVTPEGLQDLLAPRPVAPSRRQDLSGVYVDKGSSLALFISELSTFLGRQSYNVGMVSKLTDLYESKDHDTDYTKKDGKQHLRNVYVNFVAATTPNDMDSVLPEEAFGGGLMSRTIVVYEENPLRRRPLPIRINGGPTHDDLKEGLAWIAANAFGPYTLSQEAVAYYYLWYDRFKDNFQAQDTTRKLSMSRMDVLLLKVALLIRAQRYELGRQIEKTDLLKAEQLLNKTYGNNEEATKNVGATERGRIYYKVGEYIKKHGECTRRKVLTAFSRYTSSEELSSILDQLREAGNIEVWNDGAKRGEITRSSKELYVYTGEGDV